MVNNTILNASPTSLLRRPAVERRVGLSRSAIYARMAEGSFPTPVRIGARAVAWRDSDVTTWINSRPLVVEGGAR